MRYTLAANRVRNYGINMSLQTMQKFLLVLFVSFMLSACWNGGNVHVSLGDVSLGQQLMDLKTALDEEAISDDEYRMTKESILALADGCEEEESDDDGIWF